jgi:hypothetical protein
MKIASLVEVVRGRLLNSPSVGEVGGFSFSPETTKRGDCYFHEGGDADLSAALANGAFAAVCSRATQLRDGEIAWIAVEDMNRALAGLARYLLVERNIAVFSAPAIAAKIARAVIADKRLIVAPSFKEAIGALSRYDEPIFLCPDSSELLETAINIEPISGFAPVAIAPPSFASVAPAVNLFASPVQAESQNAAPLETAIKIVRETLMETTIVYRDRRFVLALPSLFAPELFAVIAFAERFGLQIRLDRVIALDRFNIYAIANGERALIFDRANAKEEPEAIAFIRRVAPWAKLYIPKGGFDPSAAFTCAYLNGFEPAEVFAALPKFVCPPLFTFDD